MAKLNVEVILGLVDKLSGPLRSIRGTLETWSDPLGAVRENLERITALSANLVIVGAGLNRTGEAMMSPLRGAADAAMTFESALADVKKVVDFDTPEEFDAFAQRIERLSRTTPLTAEGLAAIAAAGGQLGISAADLPSYMDTVSKMATAFDMLPDVAGEAMAMLSNVYGLPIQQMGLLGDAINHLSDNSASKASAIVEVLGRIGGVAKPFGLATHEASALASTMLALGETPERAGTAIQAMLTKLQTAEKGTKRFQAGLDAIGMSGKDMAAAIRDDAQGALLDLLTRLEGLDEQARTGVLVDLFGEDHGPKLAKLAGATDMYREALALVGDEAHYAGSMQTEFANRSATTQNALTLLRNRVSELKRTIGDALLPVINAVTARLGGVISRVADFLRAHPRLTAALALIAAGLAAAAVVGGALIVALAGIMGSLALLALAIGPVGALLARLLIPLRMLPGPLRVFARVAIMAFAGPAGAVALLASSLRNFGGAILRVLTFPASLIAGLRGILTSAAAVPGALGKIMFVLRALGAVLMANPLGLALTGIAAAALLVYKYWEPIKGFFSGLWSGLVEGLAPIGAAFSGAFAGIMPILQPVLDGLGWVRDKIAALLAPVEDTGGAAEAMGKRWGLAIAGMINTIGELLGKLLALPGKVFNIGADIVQGLWDGWKSKWEAFKGWVTGLADVIPEWLKKPLRVQSPSKVFAAIGRNLIEGLQQGVTVTAPKLLKDLGGVARGLAAVPFLAAPLGMPQAGAPNPPVIAPPVIAAQATRIPPQAAAAQARFQALAQDDPESKARDERRLGWLRDAHTRVQAPLPERLASAQPAAGTRGRSGSGGSVSMPISITVSAQPGTDARELAGLVREQVEKATRDAGRRISGALYDQPDDM